MGWTSSPEHTTGKPAALASTSGVATCSTTPELARAVEVQPLSSTADMLTRLVPSPTNKVPGNSMLTKMSLAPKGMVPSSSPPTVHVTSVAASATSPARSNASVPSQTMSLLSIQVKTGRCATGMSKDASFTQTFPSPNVVLCSSVTSTLEETLSQV